MRRRIRRWSYHGAAWRPKTSSRSWGNRLPPPEAPPPGARSEKTCPRCHQLRPSAQFGRNWGAPDGLQVYCRPCRSKYDQERRLRVEEEVLRTLGGRCVCCSVDKPAFLAVYQRGEPRGALGPEAKLQVERLLDRVHGLGGQLGLFEFIRSEADLRLSLPSLRRWIREEGKGPGHHTIHRVDEVRRGIEGIEADMRWVCRERGHGPLNPRLPEERRRARLNPERTFYGFVLQEIRGYPWREEYRGLMVGGGIKLATQARLDGFFRSKGRGYGGFTPEGLERFFATLPKPKSPDELKEERERIRRTRARVRSYVALCANCAGEIARSGTCPHLGGKPLPTPKVQELEAEDLLQGRRVQAGQCYLTFVAIDSEAFAAVKKYQWPYNREDNRLASVGAALDLLEKAIGR